MPLTRQARLEALQRALQVGAVRAASSTLAAAVTSRRHGESGAVDRRQRGGESGPVEGHSAAAVTTVQQVGGDGDRLRRAAACICPSTRSGLQGAVQAGPVRRRSARALLCQLPVGECSNRVVRR